MKVGVGDSEKCVGCWSCMFACARRQGVGGLAKACLGVRVTGGMERRFIVVVCRACQDPPCARVCPTGALTIRKGGGVRLDMEKCIGCRICVNTCLIGAIFWDNSINKPMICVHCGYCVKYCPHQVLVVEKQETDHE
ncbi:MAG: 4Fe-4S binding protein [Chloroflexi bacterium]|nr:4Fe-4S binding protein [Chloroflexota bacterium]